MGPIDRIKGAVTLRPRWSPVFTTPPAAALCAVAALFGGTPPAAAAIPPLPEDPPTFCDWVFNAQGSPPADGAPRPDYVDLYAGYWELYFGSGFPAGTVFRIRGQYPLARYFSFQVLDNVYTSLQTLAFLSDFEILPDPGSLSPYPPYPAVDVVHPSIATAAGSYTIDLVLSPRPAHPAPNTLYLDLSNTPPGETLTLTYRLYGDFDGVAVAQHGAVPLPAVSEVAPGGEVPAVALETKTRCAFGLHAENAELDGPATALGQANSFLGPPGAIPLPSPKAPQFMVFDPAASKYAINRDERYVYAKDLSPYQGDLLLVRMLAPSYATSPTAGTDSQLRYWSVCESGGLKTLSCLRDEGATLDGGGFVNLVLSVPSKQPVAADAAHGFNWLDFGATQSGVLIYRQLLAAPDFTQSAFSVHPGDSPQTVMGDYFPVATYCSGKVFAAYAGTGETPAQVFAACRAGK
ncbi:MAG: hypothetical protein P4L83_12985 [Nevskia sp.]|nr:hypothetical protein [Nevskia sp.]